MPERNLVSILLKRQAIALIVVGLTIASTQIGCSKLRQSTFNRDLLGNKSEQADWSTDLSDSASRYVANPDSGLDKSAPKDSARILDPVDESGVKLVATPAPSLSTHSNSQTASAVDPNCDHGAECDCHKPKLKPVLPYAEPVEPPVYEMTPPSGLVSQPLAPILFNAATRQIDVTEINNTENSLRRNERWSNEQVAQLESKQNLDESAGFDDSRMVVATEFESEVAIAESKTEQLEKSSWRDLEQTKIATDLDLQPQICLTCDGLSCDGSCVSQTRRAATKNLQPVVNSDPIVIVATISTDTIPPFADHPINTVINVPDTIESQEMKVEYVEEVIEVATKTIKEVPFLEVDEPGTPELPVGMGESFDDLTDDEWLAMFGPNPAMETACPVCASSECRDPNCGQTPMLEVAETPAMENVKTPLVSETNDFQFPTVEPTTVPQDTPVQIEVTQAETTENVFLPVTHLAEVDESNDFEVAPQKTIKLPVFAITTVDQTVHVPDAGPTPLMRRPQLYNGPAVRFEVIDNTVPWSEKLDETIQSVQSRLSIESEPEAKNGLEVNLRLLEVLKRQMVDVEERKDALTNEEKQVWQHQLDAIALMLNSDDEGSDLDRHNTAINTLGHLRKAVERLESIADLKISNGEFCTEVSGFGQFKTFASTTFQSNQRMLIYCEVENYSSIQREVNAQSQVQTRLRGSYAIYDQQGKAVQQSEYPIVDDIARKRRRDFYMHFPIQLNNLPAGQYQLQLLVEDLNSNKSAGLEPVLEFEVK